MLIFKHKYINTYLTYHVSLTDYLNFFFIYITYMQALINEYKYNSTN